MEGWAAGAGGVHSFGGGQQGVEHEMHHVYQVHRRVKGVRSLKWDGGMRRVP